MTYARWWRALWSVVTAVGVGIAILQMSPLVTFFAVLLLASSAAVVILVVRGSLERRHPGRERAGSSDTAMQAVRWGTTLLGAVTIIGGSPPVALLLALMAVTTCPPVVRLCRAATNRERASRGAATPSDRQPTADDAARMVGRLSDGELCEMWRATFWELHEQHTGDERLTLVMLRQTCLDELGRRNPEALQAWLSSGARASSGPDRFLHRPDHGSNDAA
jgi:hypothetical protein